MANEKETTQPPQEIVGKVESLSVSKYADAPLSNGRLIVKSDVTFEFRGEIIDTKMLNMYYEHWRGYTTLAGIGEEWLSEEADRKAFFGSLYELVPLTLETLPNTRFKVEFMHFPYQINGEEGFCHYALRLVPVFGGIIKSELRTTNLAVYSLTQEAQRLKAELGNGSLNLEVYFSPTEVHDKLRPTSDFKYRIWLQPYGGDGLVLSGDFYYREPFREFWEGVEEPFKIPRQSRSFLQRVIGKWR